MTVNSLQTTICQSISPWLRTRFSSETAVQSSLNICSHTTPFRMDKWLWCDHSIRACNKLKWLTPLKWASENIVANIDDQIVLFVFYALQSTALVFVVSSSTVHFKLHAIVEMIVASVRHFVCKTIDDSFFYVRFNYSMSTI